MSPKLSPPTSEQRRQADLLFLRLRKAFPRLREIDPKDMWEYAAIEVANGVFDASPRPGDEDLGLLDPEGLAFIESMATSTKGGAQ